MNRNQLERWAYAKPEVTINPVDTEALLSTSSKFNGGHNQGHVGIGGGDAKQGWFDEEEEEDLNPAEERSYQSWNE
ncbi:MAG: hypothetical protein ACTTJL_03330 [Hoylesella enoeca]|uniref:hypothetical protein n=1 Tax=Hoylesella enoeca TaxID=76123 RepID=UPI003FA0C8B1